MHVHMSLSIASENATSCSAYHRMRFHRALRLNEYEIHPDTPTLLVHQKRWEDWRQAPSFAGNEPPCNFASASGKAFLQLGLTRWATHRVQWSVGSPVAYVGRTVYSFPSPSEAGSSFATALAHTERESLLCSGFSLELLFSTVNLFGSPVLAWMHARTWSCTTACLICGPRLDEVRWVLAEM